MRIFLRYCAPFVVLAVLMAAYGQTPGKEAGKAPAQSPEQEHAVPAEPTDSLGRDTPHDTVFGFLQAAQTGHYKEASQYLRLSKRERASEGERLAQQLQALMDSAFVGRVGTISDRPEGTVQPGVPQDHERIGVFRANEKEANVDLVRVTDPAAGNIWLFSSQTLAEVPELFSQIESHTVDSKLPPFLAKRVFNTPLWRLIAFLLLIPISLGLAWAVVGLLRATRRIWRRWRHYPALEDFGSSIQGPARLILTILFHATGVAFLGLGLLFREYYRRIAGILLIAGFAWLVTRLIERWGERARIKALISPEHRSDSLILLGQRILKVLVVIVAVLVMISMLGFDMTTAIAGLGIGSIALAFAAQKTLENLFGGISILGDQVIRVGETCVIGGKEGTVEDISLRSTRIRTLDRTELSVPNGQLANMNVENLSRRDMFLFQAKIDLRPDTSPEQLRSLLDGMRAFLGRHPKVDPKVARVRFTGLSEIGLEVQIHCHILTNDGSHFLEIREALLLQLMDLIAQAGTGLAFRPSQDVGLEQGRSKLGAA